MLIVIQSGVGYNSIDMYNTLCINYRKTENYNMYCIQNNTTEVLYIHTRCYMRVSMVHTYL